MATAKEFEDLVVWKESRELARTVYSLTKEKAFYADFALRDQIRRAAVSILSNIAEGFDRGSRKEFIQFLHIAKASSSELRTQLYVALDQGYVPQTAITAARDASRVVSRRIASFIQYLEKYPDNARTRQRP